jgi:NADPH2:quinone reductase
MTAAALAGFGDAGAFQLIPLPVPTPGPGEVLIRVAYAGVNPADWKDREGYFSQFYDVQFPHIVGFDASGTIAAIGEGVTGFAPGDRVLTVSAHGQGGQGSYAEYLPVPADRVATIPDELSLEQAAVLPVAALTAWQALHDKGRGHLQPGQAVLINGGAGGVGTFAVQFARLCGARVAATCSAANADYVRGLGAELVIDYRRGRLPEAIAGWATGGVDLLVDAVGPDSLPEVSRLVRPGGRLVSIATLNRDGDIEALTAAAAAHGIHRIFAVMDDENSGPRLSAIAAQVARGELQLPPIETFALAEVATAHRMIETGHVRGKLALRVCGDPV